MVQHFRLPTNIPKLSSFPVLDSTECYDSEKEEWIMLSARLNRRRHDFGCTSYGDQIYVAGGYDGTLEPLRSVEVFSAKSKQWTIHSNLNSRRRHFELGVTALTISSRLYAIGGSSARDLEYLDTRTSSWKQIPSSDKGIKQPYHRDSTAIATDRKFIYFIGGQYKDKNPLVISDKKGRSVYCYDTFGDGWSQIQDMIERRSGAKAIVKYDCKPSSKADGSKLPYKHDGSGRGNQGHADGTSFKRGMSHVSGEAPRQHESGLTTGSENRPSQAKLQSPVSKTARVKDISKIDQSNVAKSPKGARRNLGATGGSPSRVHQKSGIQGGARPKYSAQQRNSPGVRRKLNTPTKTYQPGATTQTGWQYNDGKSPKTRRRCEESIESGARPKTSTRPKIGTTKSSPTEPISIGVGALSPTARGSTSKPPTGIGSPVMQRNLGKSGSPARRRLESPTTRRKPVGVYLRPQVGSSPKSGAVYDARRRPATPPSNVYHSVSPGRRRLLPTPPYLFRPIQHTSPVRDPLKQDAPATYGEYLNICCGGGLNLFYSLQKLRLLKLIDDAL